MKTQTFEVPRHRNGTDLLTFLADSLGWSRNRAKGLLDNRCVLVNQSRVWMAKHALRAGQVVTIVHTAEVAPSTVRAGILHEDSDYLVVNKPAGCLSNGPDSLESRLRTERHEPALRAAHRLDKDTSGCLLLARSGESFRAVVEVFRQGGVHKLYHAIVTGKVRRDEATINLPLHGKPASTEYKKLDARAEASHLLVRIQTGRTHQIRQHLTAVGHPLVGDRRYGTHVESTARTKVVARQMLHSFEIAFTHPQAGTMLRARAPLPADFKACLKMFGLT